MPFLPMSRPNLLSNCEILVNSPLHCLGAFQSEALELLKLESLEDGSALYVALYVHMNYMLNKIIHAARFLA